VEHVIGKRNLRIVVVMSSALGVFFEVETYTSSDNKGNTER